ncbi:Mrp/NBP35 family ATP-binding protein [Acidiferrimicrobium sp. IK]|uniref:Mrp/NBP35 family ATP-binding protein n=1 Tax=Acidiferrimicrobium sp. IK TaxID=2871700 RepID=UPI0021CB986A|nr:Mrp/NBP35 family ATP-binding protein [Acidiferrimicrobium sp. IK]MCU4185841.1 Mrp/NBP35 family ATP-binding protein [Acidiferrimicrobium sp. IK]
MGLSQEQVIDALRPVTDPELHVSIVELDMVRAVDIKRGRVAVTVALTVPGCPLRDEITRRVTAAVSPLPGVKGVTVELTVMTPDELDRVRQRMQAMHGAQGQAGQSHAGHSHGTQAPAGGQQPLGHEEGKANPFQDPASPTRVIGITSGKGGVGKSSVTVNLAISLVKAGFDVAILDADVYGFSIPGMLGIDADPTVRDNKMVPPVAYGVRCMSVGFFVDEDQPVMWRGPMLHKALEQFLVDVEWGTPDFLLIDMPPGTGDVALSMAQYLPSSEIYVVTTPQEAAKRVAQRTAYMAKKINLPLRGVIENMSWFTGDDGKRYELFGAGGGQELAGELGVPLLGQIPLATALRQGGDSGQPVTVADQAGEVAEAFAALAKEIVARGRTRIFRPELTIR